MTDQKELEEIKECIAQLDNGVIPDDKNSKSLEYIYKFLPNTERLSYINKQVKKTANKLNLNYEEKLLVEEYLFKLSELTPSPTRERALEMSKELVNEVKAKWKNQLKLRTKDFITVKSLRDKVSAKLEKRLKK
jgi:hypothetical protein